MYEKYCELRDKMNVTDYKVSKETGIPRSTFSDWKTGRSAPKSDKLKLIANYFGVPVDYFVSANMKEQKLNKAYYFDDETAELAQELYDDPQMRSFMSSSRKLTPEQFKIMQNVMIELLRKDGKIDD